MPEGKFKTRTQFNPQLTWNDYKDIGLSDAVDAYSMYLESKVINGIMSDKAAQEAMTSFRAMVLAHNPLLRTLSISNPNVFEEIWDGRRKTFAGIDPADLGVQNIYTTARWGVPRSVPSATDAPETVDAPTDGRRPTRAPTTTPELPEITDIQQMAVDGGLAEQFHRRQLIDLGGSVTLGNIGFENIEFEDFYIAITGMAAENKAYQDYWRGVYQAQTGKEFDPNNSKAVKQLNQFIERFGSDPAYIKEYEKFREPYLAYGHEALALDLFNDKKNMQRFHLQNKYDILSDDYKTLKQVNKQFRDIFGEDLWTREQYQAMMSDSDTASALRYELSRRGASEQEIQQALQGSDSIFAGAALDDFINARRLIMGAARTEAETARRAEQDTMFATQGLLRNIGAVKPQPTEQPDVFTLYNQLTGRAYDGSDPAARKTLEEIQKAYYPQTAPTPQREVDLGERFEDSLSGLKRAVGNQHIARFIESSPHEVITKEVMEAYERWFSAINAPRQHSLEEAQLAREKRISEMVNEIARLQKMRTEITAPDAPDIAGVTPIDKGLVGSTIDEQLQYLNIELQKARQPLTGSYQTQAEQDRQYTQLQEQDPLKQYLSEQPWLQAYYRRSPTARGFSSYRYTPQTRWTL